MNGPETKKAFGKSSHFQALGFCHGIDEFKVHPLSTEAIHDVGRRTQAHQKAETWFEEVSVLAVWPIHAKANQSDDDHRENQHGVEEAERN